MSKRDKLMQDYEHEPCSGCLGLYDGPRNQAHHGLVRRIGVSAQTQMVRAELASDEPHFSQVLTMAELLYDYRNIVPVHYRCHVPESDFLRIYSALVLSVRVFNQEDGDPKTLTEWVKKLPTKIPLQPPRALLRVDHLWEQESKVGCPICGLPYLHFVHLQALDLCVEDFVTGGPVVCWRCLWTNLSRGSHGKR